VTARRSLGLAGAISADVVRELAPAVEAAGFHALWVNDTPDGDSIAVLAAAAAGTSVLGLATGVVPVDRRPGDEVVDAVLAAGLPLDRLRIGIGAGRAPHPVRVTAVALEALHARLPDVPVVVGALGPRMRRFAAERGDGVLLNWLTPAAAADAMAGLARDRGDRPADAVPGILYARTIADEGARPRLMAEASRYGAVPAYAANFARLGVQAAQTTIDASLPTAAEAAIAEAEIAPDELVLRAITAGDTLDELLTFVERTAPRA